MDTKFYMVVKIEGLPLCKLKLWQDFQRNLMMNTITKVEVTDNKHRQRLICRVMLTWIDMLRNMAEIVLTKKIDNGAVKRKNRDQSQEAKKKPGNQALIDLILKVLIWKKCETD